MPSFPSAHRTAAAVPAGSRPFAVPRWAPPLLLGLGALLRLRQYAANRSLWHDEASLALNILERGFRGLLAPLDYGQVAPPGFLWLEKASTLLLGPGERALRLAPLLFALASLPLFDAVARRCLGGRGRLVALALFATTQPLVWYASEVKQYSGDVALVLAVTLLALEASRRAVPVRLALGLGVLGALAVWFSHAVVFALAGAGLALGFDALRRRAGGELRRLAIPASLWAASSGALWWFFLQPDPSRADLTAFWRFAFLPFPPRGLDDWLWLPRQLLSMMDLAAGLHPAALGALAFAGGAVALALRRGRAAAILGLPGVAALGASALGRYPFFQRFVLFFVPAVLIFAAEGAECASAWVSRRAPRLGAAVPLLLLAAPLGQAAWHLAAPPARDDLRPVLAEVAERARPGDTLWIYYGATRQFHYYAPRFGLDGRPQLRGLGPVRDRLQRRWGQWPRLELKRLRGRGRVWLVFSNVRTPSGHDDEASLVALLDLYGRRLDRVEAQGAAAYLYDLGGPHPESPS